MAVFGENRNGVITPFLDKYKIGTLRSEPEPWS